jgi:predicted transcriptional regulator
MRMRAPAATEGDGTTSYTLTVASERTVKITVSIPASLFDGADRLARRRGVPRSRLYAEALQRYVDEDSESEVTRQLDELAAEMDTSVDPVVKELQRRALTRHVG